MDFNLKGFMRFSRSLSSRILDAEFRWTPRHIAILVAFYIFYPLLEILVWFGLRLDDLLFRQYRQVQVREPVFIVGNPRSGTTLLHRLLAEDTARFSTMKMWHILVAPSITQRQIVRGLSALDRLLGSPLDKILTLIERRWQDQNVMHQVSLRAPEEDDYLLMHIWSALTAGLSSGILSEAMPYTYFDTRLPAADRNRIMRFYYRCLQRHMYFEKSDGSNPPRHYLAKNPALSPKLHTVLEHIPDAKIIYLVRSPLEMVPSYLSMMQFSWHAAGVCLNGGALRNYIEDMARHWYYYPLAQLDALPKDSHLVVNYNDLVADLEGTVARIYDHFGFTMSPEFRGQVRRKAAASHRYHSNHSYSLPELGLTREQIVAEYREIFDRFGFDTDSEP
jgi:hypothetical protein